MGIKATFQNKLNEIQSDVLSMGSMVEKAIGHSVDALKRRDISLAKQVIADDANIDKKRFNIEKNCIQLIKQMRRQPIQNLRIRFLR